jgi:Zn-dependent membrane protease YugP
MLYSLLLLFLIYGLRVGPPLVFSWATRRYGANRPDLEHTGKELARLLLDQRGLTEVAIEELPSGTPDFGDAYDPAKRVVQLSPNVAHQRSVAAYAVAAHEVGHALQHAEHDANMELQHGLVAVMRVVLWLFIGSVVVLLVADYYDARERWHWLSTVMLGVFLGGTALLRLVTLPVEWNASFSHALPMLRAGRLLNEDDLNHARNLLFVAATTYIAFAALGVLAAFLILTGD